MAEGIRYNGGIRLPAGIENALARNRARERARCRTASHYRKEYLILLAAAKRDTAILGTHRTKNGHQAAAKREICRRHPRTYRRYLAAERAKERIVPLPLGSPPSYPHGTEVAYRRHRRNREPPCDACWAWYDQAHQQECRICGRTYINAQRREYCSEDCQRIAGWLRYWHLKANNRKRRATGPFVGTMVREAAERAGLDLDELAARWIRDPERSA